MADTETKLNEDPKNVQDLTGFVPFLIIPASKLILSCFAFVGDGSDITTANARQVSTDVRSDHHKEFDEMSTRIDDLEKNIGDLMEQAGVDEPEK